MIIHIEHAGQKAILKIKGRFDIYKLRHFQAAYEPLLQQTELQVLEIEMSDIHFFNSSSLGMLLQLRENAREEGKTVQLSKPSQAVAQTLGIANFERLFAIAW